MVTDWVSRTDNVLLPLLPLFEPLVMHPGFTEGERQTISWLSTSCIRTIGSALILVENNRLWDAEILLRSTFEATIKFVYILSDRSVFSDRIREYHDDLFDITSIKDHNRAEQVLAVAQDPSSDQWQPIRDLLLQPSAVDAILSRYDRATRRELERKWGFAGLVTELLATGDSQWQELGMLFHVYRNASHILHADYQGIAMVMEREYREEIRKQFIHHAHAARLLSDMISLTLIRLAVSYRFLDLGLDIILEQSTAINELLNEFRKSAQAWSSFEYGKNEL